MTRYLLGQHLSERGLDRGSPDPVRVRIWAALRYLTMVAAVLVIVTLESDSFGGALLLGLGGGAAMSGLLNVVFLPRGETKPWINLTLIVGGATAAALGLYSINA